MSEEFIFKILGDWKKQFENFKKGKLDGNLIVQYFDQIGGQEPKYQEVEGTKKEFIAQTTRKVIEGKACLRVGNDSFYIGDVSKSKKHGFGYHVYNNFIVYKGKYKNGMKVDGYVFHLETKEKIYEGGWKNDMYNGTGYLKKLSGERYDGTFKDGASHGKGSVVWPNGDKYVGEFDKGFICGQGKLTKQNGDRYEGEFMDNMFNGHGTYYWKNGDVYEGDFIDGEFSGKGTMKYTQLGCYGEGEWDGSQKKLLIYDLNESTNKDLYDKSRRQMK